MQTSILLITLLAMAVVTLPFYIAIKNSGEREEDFSTITEPGYRFRSKWFLFLTVLGVVLMSATMLPFPYSSTSAGEHQVVNAVGGQWYWTLDKNEFEAGKPIHFKISSADVNHGFAVYSSDDVLVGQSQAMPGYVNELKLTLDSGEYTVFCLEYCGLAHHSMFAKFNVVEAINE